MIRTLHIRGTTDGRTVAGKDLRVKQGCKLQILGGYIYHVTGTDTYLAHATLADASLCEIIRIAAATASGGFMLNNKITTNYVVSVETKGLWFNHDTFFILWGDASVGADILVEEIPLNPEELTYIQKEKKLV